MVEIVVQILVNGVLAPFITMLSTYILDKYFKNPKDSNSINLTINGDNNKVNIKHSKPKSNITKSSKNIKRQKSKKKHKK